MVEICVPDRGNTHNRKGETDVGGKDVVAGGLCVGRRCSAMKICHRGSYHSRSGYNLP